ncbi:MAG: glycosyltransferase [Prevotella sp.]|nr:glycosyltransferase [Prevotella sp.]MBR6495017.1 glycosyltransferase [Prevotella sp.]
MEKKDKLPIVSVIMATYNDPVEYLSQAIDSILNQTYENLELLIADDSTETETINAIDEYARKDARIIVVRKEQKMGIAGARNEALLKAKGQLIALMDADDVSLPDRLEKQVEFARKHVDIDLFGGHIYIIDEKNKVTSLRKYMVGQKQFKRMFAYRNPLAHPTIMFRRTIVDDGFLYDPTFKKAEDLEFYLRLHNNGYRLANMDDFLLNYRIVGDMQKKRQYDNWSYNHKARLKNFNWRKPMFSVASWFFSCVYLFTPNWLISFLYGRENHKIAS